MAATLINRNAVKGGAAARRISRSRRHYRVRKQVSGTAARPRLVVTRTLRHIYAQVIDDVQGHTLVSASTLDASLRGAEGEKKELARRVGELLAERARDAGVTQVVFDRGGNAYHGRVAALADAARSGGLEF